MEPFFGQFKTESCKLKTYKTFEELSADIDHYIYFYNNHPYHKRSTRASLLISRGARPLPNLLLCDRLLDRAVHSEYLNIRKR
ncbi:IS3 family transposase [Streptococcus ratti]|uniref:IS3 family transposase n=1 Tax=Streptococcus ratti TaxID=1341 RepID=UPI003CCCA599